LVNPLLEKKACSPAEKMNSSVQSRQVKLRSWYTLSRPSCARPVDGVVRGTEWGRVGDGARLKGCAPGRTRARGPELIAVKIRAPSSPVTALISPRE
jgi:hypothetical protein